MVDMIIEMAVRTDTNSMGLETDVPVVNFTYFETDPETGARYVDDIVQADLEHLDPCYAALHTIDWQRDFDAIEIRAWSVGVVARIERKDSTQQFSACAKASAFLSMMKADFYGYLDHRGRINKDKGINLFEAYRLSAPNIGTMVPYLMAGRNKL